MTLVQGIGKPWIYLQNDKGYLGDRIFDALDHRDGPLKVI